MSNVASSATAAAKAAATAGSKRKHAPSIRAVGFCGADDSVHPNMLGILANAYPNVEFGVLFRPDLEGQPRYASSDWVNKLALAQKKIPHMKLAAHLCGSRVNDVLQGDDHFVKELIGMGFGRIQINATAVNGVDTSALDQSALKLYEGVIKLHSSTEFIIQKNEETKPLWQALLDTTEIGKGAGFLPSNLTMLVDESKGTGVLAKSWPTPPEEYEIGYAGGIGPDNIVQVLESVKEASNGRSVWIDMESRLRSIKNGKDVFDLDKCYHVIDAVCQAGVHAHPDYLSGTHD